MKKTVWAAILTILAVLTAPAGTVNMDYEAKNYSIAEKDAVVPVLPPLLTTATIDHWQNFRRQEILQLLARECYGELPPPPEHTVVTILNESRHALGGNAIRRELKLEFTHQGRKFAFIMLVYLPANASKTHKVPAFAGLNFLGNHHTVNDPAVTPTGGRFGEPGRGKQAYRWGFEEAVKRGYASATVCYHDVFPNAVNCEQESIFSLFYPPQQYGEIYRRHSVISGWAWGMIQMKKALQQLPEIAPDKIIAHGHSRLGKTALWAGACDPEFAMVIANDSGCGGAALHKRKFGENLSRHFEAHLERGIPVWFNQNLHKYINKEELLPFDAHFLLALIAPRQLCIGSAAEDFGADPKGEFLSCVAASQVYELYGFTPFGAKEMIAPDTHVPGIIHYHLRTGKHDQTPHDWGRYLDAADRYFNPLK